MKNYNLAKQMFFLAEKYKERAAFRYQEIGSSEWREISWGNFGEKIVALAKGLIELGISEEQNIAQFSQNMPHNFVVDFALFANRCVLVPIYPTSSASQVEYILNDAAIELIFVGEQVQYDIAVQMLSQAKSLKKIVAFDKSVKLNGEANSIYFDDLMILGEKSDKDQELKARQAKADEQDLAAILYTSGTTGTPKGAMLIHEGLNVAMRTHTERLVSVSDKDVSIAFLPVSHVFERLWCYFCLFTGVEVVVNLNPLQIQQTIKEIRPTLMCAVPRFWEKVYAGVKENLSNYSSIMLGVIAWAIATGKKHNVDYLRVGKKPSAWLAMQYKIADKLIFSKVKLTLGIENGNLFPTAGAALSDTINLFLQSIGVPIYYGYGLTESYATVSCFPYIGYEIGSVGIVMPELEVKIGDESEILLRGKTIFKGYYKRPDANAEAFTADGFFRTGDAGYLKDGHLYLVERIKDLFKTSNGKYIAPQQIEILLATDKFIEQIAVIGDQRNYATALIVPAMPEILKFAKINGIAYTEPEELLDNKVVYAAIEERIAELQGSMANYEKIKKFTLLKKPFSIESGELTNTLKIRRAIVYQKYAMLIDEMYNVKSDPTSLI